MNSEERLIELINEYVSCSKYLIEIIKANFPVQDSILRSLRLKLIPKSGQVNNIKFAFHGGGCFFELENDKIDVDFGPDDRVDGFSLQKLTDFLINRKDRFSGFNNEQLLKDSFNELINQKIIVNPEFILTLIYFI